MYVAGQVATCTQSVNDPVLKLESVCRHVSAYAIQCMRSRLLVHNIYYNDVYKLYKKKRIQYCKIHGAGV